MEPGNPLALLETSGLLDWAICWRVMKIIALSIGAKRHSHLVGQSGLIAKEHRISLSDTVSLNNADKLNVKINSTKSNNHITLTLWHTNTSHHLILP